MSQGHGRLVDHVRLPGLQLRDEPHDTENRTDVALLRSIAAGVVSSTPRRQATTLFVS